MSSIGPDLSADRIATHSTRIDQWSWLNVGRRARKGQFKILMGEVTLAAIVLSCTEMRSSRRALLVFTRSPEAEARAKGFALEQTAGLFAAFLASWKRAAEGAGASLLISTPPRCAKPIQANGLYEDVRFLVQSPARFGRRLASAVEGAFQLGFSSVSVVAGDTPAIPSAELDGVFEALERRDAPFVVGPACDGGVYLIGLPRADIGFLARVSLRNPRTCDEIVSSLEQGGKKVSLLASRDEVDSLADLQRLFRSSAANEIWGKYRFLLSLALEPAPSAAPESAPIPGLIFSISIPARAPPAS